MEVTELKAFSEHALEFAKNFLREHKHFNPMFQVLSAEGLHVIAPEDLPDGVDEHVAKDALAETVRALVREKQAQAVINIGDAWVMALDEKHPFFREAASRQYPMEQLERMGVGKRREALVLTLETPIYTRIMEQFYYRNAEGNIIFRELKEDDSTNRHWKPPVGRFYGFFEEPQSA
jgi:hypothetical protein